MKDIPSLQKTIEEKAEKRLSKTLDDMSDALKNMAGKQFPIISGVTIRIYAGTHESGRVNYSTPYLSQLFDNEEVRRCIREEYLPRFIKEEIDNILVNK